MANGAPPAQAPPILSRTTLIPLGAAISLLVVIIGVAISLDRRLVSIDYRLDRIEADLNRGTADRWTRTDMDHWADLFKAKNENIVVPPVKLERD